MPVRGVPNDRDPARNPLLLTSFKKNLYNSFLYDPL